MTTPLENKLWAEVVKLRNIVETADFATHAECTCGGKPDNDATACPACKIYHRIEAAKRRNA